MTTPMLWEGVPLIRDSLPALGEECCCGQPVDCDECSSGTTPYQYDVTFANVGENGCGSCANWNTKFRCTQEEYAPGNWCYWIYRRNW